MALEMDELEQEFDQLDDPILKCSLLGLFEQRMQDFRGFRDRDTEIFDKILAVLEPHALAFRSTSVVIDEALCLTTFFDMNMIQSVRVPLEDRKAHFCHLFDTVPARISFLHHPKLAVQRLR